MLLLDVPVRAGPAQLKQRPMQGDVGQRSKACVHLRTDAFPAGLRSFASRPSPYSVAARIAEHTLLAAACMGTSHTMSSRRGRSTLNSDRAARSTSMRQCYSASAMVAAVARTHAASGAVPHGPVGAVGSRRPAWRSRYIQCCASFVPEKAPPRLAGLAASAKRAAASVAAAVSASAQASAPEPTMRASQRGSQAVLASSFLFSAAGNKILLRILLLFASPYTHLLGVLTNALYIVTFAVQLSWAGVSRRDVAASLQFASRGFGLRCLAVAGLCEAMAFVMMPLFASRLPGSLLPVMSQGLLLFSMLFGIPLLGKRYTGQQVAGVATVVSGVCICTLGGGFTRAGVSPATAGSAVEPLSGFSSVAYYLFNAAGLFGAYAFIALAITVKELAFRQFREAAPAESGNALRMEVVNLFTALWQGLALLLLWPVNFALITPLTVAEYFATGATALWCARGLLLLYLCVNLSYTVSTTAVLQRLSAVALLLTNVLNVPLVSLIFCLKLPLLGATPFRMSLLVGLVVIVAGLIMYNLPRNPRNA